MTMWATKGYSPGAASLPPTTAPAGVLTPSASASVASPVVPKRPTILTVATSDRGCATCRLPSSESVMGPLRRLAPFERRGADRVGVAAPEHRQRGLDLVP